MEVDMIAAFGFNPKYLYTVSSEQRKEMVRDTQEWIEKYIEGVRANANLYVENATRSGVLKLQRWIQKYFTVRKTMPNLSGADATRLARVCYRGRSGVVAAAIPIIIPPSSTSVSDPPRSNMANASHRSDVDPQRNYWTTVDFVGFANSAGSARSIGSNDSDLPLTP
jgi:hypothetical protein